MEGIEFLDVIQLFGGIGIFLYAIKMLSESLQLLAGNSLKNLIGMLTKTPVLGVVVGALVTVLIQSSSATTVMTVSFVDAGLMTLKQAIGVIMGANVGTTITGQIIAFKLKDYIYIFVILGVILNMFGRTNRHKYLGNGLLGFGLLFIGMQTMESSMDVLRTRSDIFLAFKENPFMGLLAGTLLTVVVQSSSATVGLTIVLGTQGLLPLEAAIPIILGDNIGTTITAVLASFGTKRTAKQACLGHVLFNVIGVLIFFPLMPVYIGWIQASTDSIAHQIANAHTFFNVVNACLFLPFVSLFVALIKKIIPDDPKDKGRETNFLDPKLIEFTPSIAVEAVKNECLYMGSVLLEGIDTIEEIFFHDNVEIKGTLSSIEDKLDGLLVGIQKYSQEIMRAGVTDQELLRLHCFVRNASDMERIGDKCNALLSIYNIQKEQKNAFSHDATRDLRQMFDKANSAVEIAVQNISLPLERAKEMLPEVEKLALDVRNMELEIRQLHVERLVKGQCDTGADLNFLDALGTIELMAHRAKKMTQAVIF